MRKGEKRKGGNEEGREERGRERRKREGEKKEGRRGKRVSRAKQDLHVVLVLLAYLPRWQLG